MARWRIAWTACEGSQRRVVADTGQSLQQQLRCEQFGACRSQFNGKGQTIKPDANLCNGRSIVGTQRKVGLCQLGSLDEQRR